MIEITNVHRRYQTGETFVHALRGVSLTIEPGEFTAIAGPSGSGKTTLLNMIGALDQPDEGTVHIDGTDLTSANAKERARFRRRSLGFVFQNFNLIPVLSAYENVAFVLSLLDVEEDEVRRRTMELLEEVGLKGMEDRRPLKLSGGQQQRVAVARALIKQPAIVLADEPTANLDSETGAAILELMRQLNERHGTTFVFCTHDGMVMDKSRRLIYLRDGMVSEEERRAV
ncbi:MAG: ABC transporter ATP-binding protein [Alkalispirochaeta sp.]